MPDGGTDYRGAIGAPVNELSVADSPEPDMFRISLPARETVEAAASALEHARLNVDETGPDHDGSVEELGTAFETMYTTGFAAIAERVEEEVGFD